VESIVNMLVYLYTGVRPNKKGLFEL
jgi:hypothetical protein